MLSAGSWSTVLVSSSESVKTLSSLDSREMLTPVKSLSGAAYLAVSGVAATLGVAALEGLEAVCLLAPAPVGEAVPVRLRLDLLLLADVLHWTAAGRLPARRFAGVVVAG